MSRWHDSSSNSWIPHSQTCKLGRALKVGAPRFELPSTLPTYSEVASRLLMP